jgi:predicted ribosome quality control (RQC) complex YloA/Tae2 family protein
MDNKFEQYKQKAKDKLSQAIEEMDKLIKVKEEMIKELQSDFDKLDRFKPGNFIVNNWGDGVPSYYLIVGAPIIESCQIKIPVRHHVFPILNSNSIYLNMSGVIDMAVTQIDKMDKIKIITIQEYFELQKDKMKKDFNNVIPNYENKINNYKENIKKIERDIKHYENEIEKYKGIDFDAKYNEYIDAYINSTDYNHYILNCDERDYCDKYIYNLALNV